MSIFNTLRSTGGRCIFGHFEEDFLTGVLLFRGREVGGVSTVILAPCRIKTSAAASTLNLILQKYTHKKTVFLERKHHRYFLEQKLK